MLAKHIDFRKAKRGDRTDSNKKMLDVRLGDHGLRCTLKTWVSFNTGSTSKEHRLEILWVWVQALNRLHPL